MRLVFKFGLIRDSPIPSIQAAADELSKVRWFGAELSLGTIVSTLVAIIGLGITLATMKSDTNARIAAGDTDRASLHREVAVNQEHSRQLGGRIDDDVVPRACYDHDNAERDRELNLLWTIEADRLRSNPIPLPKGSR